MAISLSVDVLCATKYNCEQPCYISFMWYTIESKNNWAPRILDVEALTIILRGKANKICVSGNPTLHCETPPTLIFLAAIVFRKIPIGRIFIFSRQIRCSDWTLKKVKKTQSPLHFLTFWDRCTETYNFLMSYTMFKKTNQPVYPKQ